jgi:TonB family protein
MRTRKKFEAQVSLLIVVAPDGKAQEVKVVSSSAKSRDLETCLVEAARSWSYPEGKVAAPVHCSFYLKSSM